MQIDYDDSEDILFIKFNNEAVQKDISYGWNVHVGMTAHGIGQISILNAKADKFLPIRLPKKNLSTITKIPTRATRKLRAG